MPDSSAAQSVSPPRQRPHLLRCGWFWAWAAMGVAGALGAVSLGPIVLFPASLAGTAMARSRHGRRSWVGLFAGVGLVSLFVAYVQRDGPGTTCWHTAAAGGCAQHLDPVPWLIVGMLLFAGAIVIQMRRRTSPR
jgi:hypothetical protein